MSIYLVGGLNPSENICQLGLFFPIYGKIKHVPSKPPTIYIYLKCDLLLGHVPLVPSRHLVGSSDTSGGDGSSHLQ